MNNKTHGFNLKNALLAGVLAVSITLAGCSAKSGGLLGGGKVATVNGTVITKAEYDKTYSEFTKAFGLDKMPKEQQAALGEMLKQMTLQKLIMKTLITDEAEKVGIKITDADVQKYKQEKIFSNPVIKEQFQAFLKQSAMKESDFDAMLKENLLISKFIEKQAGPKAQVTEAEAKAFYDKNKAQFNLPERIHAEHILVKAIVPELKKEVREKNPKITDAELDKAVAAKQDELKAKAEKLFQEVKKNPAKFSEIAKADSDDTASAQRGGDLGFMTEGTTDPQFWAALKKTPDKALHPNVVSTMYGYHIVRVLERSPAHQESFAEVREQLRDQLSQGKKQDLLREWTEQKRKAAKIVIEPAYQPKEADPLAGMSPQAPQETAQQAKSAPQQTAKR
jgi:parvulin-like peptidyl-prolyl isomerase